MDDNKTADIIFIMLHHIVQYCILLYFTYILYN